MLTPEQRRKLVEAPIILNIIGSHAYAGCHIPHCMPRTGQRVAPHRRDDGEGYDPSPYYENAYRSYEAGR